MAVCNSGKGCNISIHLPVYVSLRDCAFAFALLSKVVRCSDTVNSSHVLERMKKVMTLIATHKGGGGKEYVSTTVDGTLINLDR